MRSRCPGVSCVWVLVAVVASGCATALNYDHPQGPIVLQQASLPATRSQVLPFQRLRVVTFNIKFAREIERATALLSVPPLREASVLVLQEMDEPGAARIAHALGMNHVYVPSAVHPSSHRDFGVAILSTWPIAFARKVVLPHRHRFRKLQRAAVAATVASPLGPVLVYGVHLESAFGLSGAKRREQARTLVADIGDWHGPVIMAGDFNGPGPASEVAAAGFIWLSREVHNTASLIDADHLLVRGLCAAESTAAQKVQDSHGVSDHLPVWADLSRCLS